jgi:hypothetical protein
MTITIGKEFDLSIHMLMVISLARTIMDSLAAAEDPKGASPIRMSLMLLVEYLEELERIFDEQKINID